MDWLKWHTRYNESPLLQARLNLARAQIAQAVQACPHASIRLISLCAGDGRDVIDTLVTHPRRDHTSAYLIESNPAIVAQGEGAVAQGDLLTRVQVLHADATRSSTYQAIAPADVLIVCGVFGNVRESDTGWMIEHLRCLCRRQGRVVWTRTVAQPRDQRAAELIREQFSAAGFHEMTVQHTTPPGIVVATHVYSGDPYPLTPGVKLFEFMGHDQIESS
jgi:Putative methyltransferase